MASPTIVYLTQQEKSAKEGVLERFLQRNSSKRLDDQKHIHGRARLGFIVICNEKLLLVMDNVTGIWGFPKGGMSAIDKSILGTALRKLHEETGLELNAPPLCRLDFGRNSYFVARIDQSVADSTVLNPVDPKTIGDVRWITLNDIRSLRANQDLRAFLRNIYL